MIVSILSLHNFQNQKAWFSLIDKETNHVIIYTPGGVPLLPAIEGHEIVVWLQWFFKFLLC